MGSLVKTIEMRYLLSFVVLAALLCAGSVRRHQRGAGQPWPGWVPRHLRQLWLLQLQPWPRLRRMRLLVPQLRLRELLLLQPGILQPVLRLKEKKNIAKYSTHGYDVLTDSKSNNSVV